MFVVSQELLVFALPLPLSRKNFLSLPLQVFMFSQEILVLAPALHALALLTLAHALTLLVLAHLTLAMLFVPLA